MEPDEKDPVALLVGVIRGQVSDVQQLLKTARNGSEHPIKNGKEFPHNCIDGGDEPKSL